MPILQNVPLNRYSTMRLGGVARYLAEVKTREELAQCFEFAKTNSLPTVMVGEGSNIVWRDEGFAGLVLVNKIMGFEITGEDEHSVYLTVGAGEDWDSVVARTVEKNLSGIAELSLIPGSAGATPVQNVGAYGQEIKNVLTTLEAYDTTQQKFIAMSVSDCAFGYRTSRFKTTDHGKYFISSISMVLSKDKPLPPFYSSVEEYFTSHNITEKTPAAIRQAVISIRTAKLPDPKVVANNGSFFKNPVISEDELARLLEVDPTIQYWRMDDDSIKLSGAWLIEKVGFKGVHDQETGIGTWPTQPLVLVNEHARSTADLLKFKQKIVDAVNLKFRITLEQEPELLP